MKYLFIGSHVDDCELSCGGTIAKLSMSGHDVTILAFSDCGSPQLLVEFKKSAEILGAKSQCLMWQKDFPEEKVANELYHHWRGYDFVFTHSTEDRHSHHKIVAEQSKRIFNCNLLTYLGAWNGQQEETYFVELSEKQMEKKMSALWCYKSQSHRPYMSSDFIASQARYNGVKCGKLFAEAFKIHRMLG